MARPRKNGLTYFPCDVDFFMDEKIAATVGEFGLKAESIFIHLLCAIYREGYFILWNEMVQMKLLRELPGVTNVLLQKVVDRLVLWGTFDKGLFYSMGVLTSLAIQRRYFSATKRRLSHHDKYVLDFGEGDIVPNNGVSVYRNPVSEEFMYAKTDKLNKRKKNINNSFSLFYSSNAHTRVSQEKQQEEIVSNFFFQNWDKPNEQYDKFVAFNNTGGRSWEKMSATEREAAATLWHPRDASGRVATGERFDKRFLPAWRQVLEKLMELQAGHGIIMDALSDEIRFGGIGEVVKLRCSLQLKEFIEQNIEHFKPSLGSLVKAWGARRFQYNVIDCE